MKTLSNELLTIAVSESGAELCSILDRHQTEYLWQADPAFWKRHSPVLFPIVGAVWNNEFRHDGKTYTMGQHGFARDMDFETIKVTDDELRFRLVSNADTLAHFPFAFELEIGYRLCGNNITVQWQVRNTGDTVLPFQIGAHPAFYYPDFNPDEMMRGYFEFDTSGPLQYTPLGEKGCAVQDSRTLNLTGGRLPVDRHTFDTDALIFEDSQIRRVTLCDKSGDPYITLAFAAPLVGLWSPPKKNAPFVCIEPWYGRCDAVGYAGDFENKKWIERLSAGSVFSAEYTITVERAM